MQLPGQKRWLQAWSEGMAAGKPSSARPGGTLWFQQTPARVKVAAGCTLFPLTVQLPLETSGQAWTLVPFWVRAQQDI